MFKKEFLNAFNNFLMNCQTHKLDIIRNLKLSLKNIFFVKTRERAFDLHLKEDYADLIAFLATLDLE